MAEITYINGLSTAKTMGSVFGAIGLFCGILYSCLGLVFDIALTGGVNTGTALAFLALIGMPLLFGVPAAVSGYIFCVIFNAVAKRIGGLEIQLK